MRGANTIIQPLQRLAASGRVRAHLKAIDDPRSSKGRRRRAIDSLISAIAGAELGPEARDAAVEGLLRRWSRVPAPARARLTGLAGSRIRGGLSRIIEDESPGVRLIAAKLAGPWSRAVFIRAIERLVLDHAKDVAEAAEASLLQASEQAANLKGEDAAALDSALVNLARRFPEHRRRGVLRAAAAAADRPGPELRAWLETGDDAELMPLRAEMRRTGAGVDSRARLVRLLATPALAPTAAERLGEPANAEGHEAALSLGALLSTRGRAAALRRLSDPATTLPAQRDLERLGVEARLGAAIWAAALPIAPGKRATLLAEMLGDPEPRIRFAALRRLSELAATPGAARDALEDAAFDAEPRVALTAIEELRRIDPDLAGRVSEKLRRSPNELVRAEADRSAGGRGEEVWAMLEAGDAAAWALLRARLAAEPARTAAELRGRVATGQTHGRCGAIAAARRLGLVEAVEAELHAASQDRDERVAAAAVSALGDVQTAAARAAVSTALAHPDGRVRANALEAIARRDADASVVRTWVRNETPRARGNAVRARLLLAGDPAGAEALESMLLDDRRGHRLSGLWVAERAGLTSVSERVAEIARRETEPRVRARAKRCARRLLAEMRLRENSLSLTGEAAGRTR